jgi:nitroimidazol reductase NimA-like FMN-containing flavoprotein (pyridoxamine 5'-phosphate oxidase superfamily)
MPSKKSARAKREPQTGRPHMPGYGLPAGKKGLLPWKWAEQRLRKSHNYWISTAKPDVSPHTMVVWGLWLDGAFYFSTGRGSRKAKNLAHNPRCVICTEHAEQAVIVEGTARLIKDRSTLKRFADLYQAKYAWDMQNFSEPLYRVTPRLAFGLYEKNFIGSATRWQFRK